MVQPTALEALADVNASPAGALALAPRLRTGTKVVLIRVVRLHRRNGAGGYYGYRMSKAALNAAGVSRARDLKPRGVALIILQVSSAAIRSSESRWAQGRRRTRV